MNQVYIIFSLSDGEAPQMEAVFSSMDAALGALGHLQANNSDGLLFFIEPQEVQG
jgi:hypothetical protein